MAAMQVPFTGRSSGWKRFGLIRRPMAKESYASSAFTGSGLLGMRRSDKLCGGGYGGASRIQLRSLLNQFREGPIRRSRCAAAGGSPNDCGEDGGAENFDENDVDYVNSSVTEAVEVKNGSDAFLIKMRDGRYLRCVYNQWKGGHPPDYVSHPAIVLKIEDESGLLLPIIVMEMPSALLMAALRNVELSRPSIYHMMKEVIETMGYMVKLVRITEKVQDVYFAELWIVKVGNETESLKFNLRPSDAINVAVRSKAPIQVNKYLVYSDGLKIVEPINLPPTPPLYDDILASELDRPDGQPCLDSEEFVLLRNMLIAAVEERYRDAAQWKDLLIQFRSTRKRKLA
ncbi:Bifunctional nuclease 1 [Dionaea muscipula]